MELILKVIDDVFHKTAWNDFKSFLNRFIHLKTFIIASDYCIDDNNKENDVYSFVILPDIKSFFSYEYEINSHIHQDYKKTRDISNDTLELLSSNNFLSVNFVVDKRRKLLLQEFYAKDKILAGIDSALNMIEIWKKNNPERIDIYKEDEKQFLLLRENAKAKNFNSKIYVNSFFTASMAAYLTHQIAKNSSATDVMWFSDRDSMVSSNNKIIFDLYSVQHNGISRNDKEYTHRNDLKLSVASPSFEGENWYDSLNRLFDYCAGCLSSWNFTTGSCEKEKASLVLSAIAHNSINILLSSEKVNNRFSFQAARIMINTKAALQ